MKKELLNKMIFTGSRAMGLVKDNNKFSEHPFVIQTADYDFVSGRLAYKKVREYCQENNITINESNYYEGFYFTEDDKRYNIFLEKDVYLYSWKLTTEIIKLLCKYEKIKSLLSEKKTRVKFFEGIRCIIKIIFGEIKEWQ